MLHDCPLARCVFAREVAQLQDAKAVEIEEARERVRKKSKMEMETLRWIT